MSGADSSLAVTALVIALVALLTAFGQLLQQYFATADGYRRFQSSVMGDWATKTRLRWRWREFRFETLYTVPEIFMTGDGAPGKENHVLIIGTDRSRELTNTPASTLPTFVDDHNALSSVRAARAVQAGRTHGTEFEVRDILREGVKLFTSPTGSHRTTSDELACWEPLLDAIHTTTFESLFFTYREGFDMTLNKRRVPALVLKERSWDFQPPDVVRPLAKTTISDIAVLARRMGMRWKDFRPSDGVLRAEGHSHIITSTVVRSLGIILQYGHTGQSAREQRNLGISMTSPINMERKEIYIPTMRSDQLGAGVIHGDAESGIPTFTIGTQQEIVVALRKLEKSGESAITLTAILRENPGFSLRVADIIAMTLDIIRLRGSALVQVPAPSDNVLGVTTSLVGRRAFRSSLESYVMDLKQVGKPVGQQTQVVLDICNALSHTYQQWDTFDGERQWDEHWTITRDLQFLEKVHDHCGALVKYLSSPDPSLAQGQSFHPAAFRYVDLLGLHIRFAIFCPEGETTPLQAQVPIYELDVIRYFEQLPAIFTAARKAWGWSEERVVDVWTSMMLRGFCWGACHFLVPGERVPTAYYGSQLPVYIG